MNSTDLTHAICAAALLIAASVRGPAQETTPALADRSPDKPSTYRLPGLDIDFKEKVVDIQATVCLREGLLELVACAKGTKEHESIIAIQARPSHIHAALLLLGAEPGAPALMKLDDAERNVWVPISPRGSEVDAYLVITDTNGQLTERPISDFIMRRELGEQGLTKRTGFPTNTFVFAGSRLVDSAGGPSRYSSDRSGNVLSIMHFGDELLCLPEAGRESNGPPQWEVDGERLPEVGSKAVLRLRPRAVAGHRAPNDTTPTVSATVAAPQLGAPFRDGAVLQRGMPVPVWGWGAPNAAIKVEFGGQTADTVADPRGEWSLELAPLEASFAPRRLVVSSDKDDEIVVEDVLVGEVWLASGQSNMQWKVHKSSCSKLRVEPRGEVAPIREFEVTSVVAMLHPIERADGAWKVGDYGQYSAIGFAFAHRLYHELQVPIGILNCSFSQTAIQAWVPRVGFRDGSSDYTKAIYKRILETDPATPDHKSAWDAFYGDLQRTLEENRGRMERAETPVAISTRTPGNLSDNRDASWLFNGRMNPVVPYALRGAIWNQGYANAGEGLPYYENLHSLVRGWRLRWDRPGLPVYFHQFYCPGKSELGRPSIDPTAEMRLGTWRARDIPGTGMASQIDITGSIHYWNKAVPGQRLALHALKNQYGREVVADGPMFKSYAVDGDKLVVSVEHADRGLVVAETGSNADRRNKEGTGFADPRVVPDGDSAVKLFYLAGADRVWHPARVELDGEKIVLTSPAVTAPRGVSYATGGVGFQPNIYNRALLPMTPFIYYDHEPVTAATWPDDRLEIAGDEVDPTMVGKKHEWRKMPLLSPQFRDGAVLQAGVPITFWGSAVHDHGYEAEGEAVIQFSFAGINETINVRSDPRIVDLRPGQCRFASGKDWRLTVPPMEASAEPKTLTVTFLIDGEVAHQRVCKDIVVGDVWYVAAPQARFQLPELKPSSGIVRVMKRRANRSSHPAPSRYSVCVSRTPKNRYACRWEPATDGLAAVLGHHIHAKTGRPVGIILMQNTVPRGGANPELDSWIPMAALSSAPSLRSDYEDLAAVIPGNRFYDANVGRYIAEWKRYWGGYVPQMIRTGAVPDGVAWGSFPTLSASVTSDASRTYNVLVHPFSFTRTRGIVFLSSPEMVAGDQGAAFGEQLSTLANSWRRRIGGADARFIYTTPDRSLAPRITAATGIEGEVTAVVTDDWTKIDAVIDAVTR